MSQIIIISFLSFIILSSSNCKNQNFILKKDKTSNLNEHSHYIKPPPDLSVVMRIEKENNNNTLQIGLEGTLNIVTDFNDTVKNIFDINDIEEKTSFETIIRDENNNEYNTKCRLWKPKNEKIRLFCNLNRIYKYSIHNLTFPEIIFIYKDYVIYIIFKCSIIINQLTYNVPFLYSNEQIINIQEGIDLYEFKFKSDYYDNDILIYYSGSSYNVLDDCKREDKNVLCTITKDKIEENLILFETNNFKLAFLNQDLNFTTFDLVFDIFINYNNTTEKNDIFIHLINLLTNVSESGFNIAYETNVTSISNLRTNLFILSFYDILNDKKIKSNCFFKKYSGENLLLLCNIIAEGDFSILKTDEEIKLNNISYKYNFIILPINISDSIKISGNGTEILLTYPSILNYTIEESLIIKYIMPLPNFLNKIRLNPDSTDLNCFDSDKIKMCNVPLSHFKGKKGGYYHTYHFNHLNELSICYDATSFYVILPNDNTIVLRIKEINNRNDINVGINGTLYFITDYNDKEKNIFNIKDIEEKTGFNSESINSNDNKYKYNVTCRLWKPENEKIRLFCKIKGNLKYSFQYITMNIVTIKYYNYTIIIKFEDAIKVKQIFNNVPFLYSDKQIINIEEGFNSYEFRFKTDSYFNDLLYMYAGYSYILLDNCSLYFNQNQKEKEVKCTIQKNKLEENLSSILF